jgi:solute carrier family 25 aspartate/glutamate transporter 12/13
MSSEDFIRKFLGLYNTPDYAPESVKILAGMIDTSKDGLISFKEFQAFETLLCVPDALYSTKIISFENLTCKK